MRYVIPAIVAVSMLLLLVGCGEKELTEEDLADLPPPPPPPPIGGVTGDVIDVGVDNDLAGDDLDASLDGIDIDNW